MQIESTDTALSDLDPARLLSAVLYLSFALFGLLGISKLLIRRDFSL